MLRGIEGIVEKRTENSLTLKCGFFSMLVFCPLPVITNAADGKKISLTTHLHVREDALTLFGFSSEEQLELFEHLISVSGIGPKTALDILAAGESAVISALQNEDVSFLTSIKGIGKKTAERAILELKEKVFSTHFSPSENTHNLPSSVAKEATEALEGLGWKKQEISEHLKNAPDGLDTAEKIIKWFLTNR